MTLEIKKFEYHVQLHVYFGNDQLNNLSNELKKYGKSFNDLWKQSYKRHVLL